MAALLVSVAVMAVLMSVALPVWRHEAQREKEAELAFRGEQWVRAINQYQRKSGPGVYPPSLDVLVQGRFVRKKFKDPITGEDFQPRYMGQQPGQQAGGPGRAGQPPQPQPPSGFTGGGGVMGVFSKSTATSIREYKGATRYDQWQFLSGNIGGPGQQGGTGRQGGPGRQGGRGRDGGPGVNPGGRRGGAPPFTNPGRGRGPGGGRGPGVGRGIQP